MNATLKQQTFSKPVVYGTISYSLGANKKQTDKNTHRWCAYVRGPNNEDLSTFIDKVVFVLHETFPDHQRAITKPPFEVIEKGWGEFDILIQIHFKTHYPQLELVHKLKFYGAKSGGNSQSTKKPVVSEIYDEIVFVNPSVEFYDMLRIEKYLQNEEKPIKEPKPESEQTQMEEEIPTEKEEEPEYYDWKQHYLKFDAQEHKQKLEDALAVIKEQNEKTKIDQDKCEKEIDSLNKEIEQLQKEYDLKQKRLQDEQQMSQSAQPQEGQMNDYPPSEQRNTTLPPPPSQSLSQSNIQPQNVPPPSIQNQYPPQQYPMGQPPSGSGSQQQVPPPPHMMQNNYPPQNPKMNNPYQQQPPSNLPPM